MTSLNERFVTFLENEKAAPDSRPRRGALALTLGLLTLLCSVLISLSWRRLYGAPLAPLGLWLIGWGGAQLWLRRRDRQLAVRVREVAAHGHRVNAYVVHAPDALYRPGSRVQSCQVLISFQPEVGGDREYMQYLAHRWADQTRERQRPVRYRRRALPLELTDGSTVYCCDLFVHPGLLSSGYLSSSLLPCLAQEGETGGIELVPYWLLFPYITSAQGEGQRV